MTSPSPLDAFIPHPDVRARFGIVGIRLLLLPAIRHKSERRWRVEAQGLERHEAGS